jgi:hypothetical protein
VNTESSLYYFEQLPDSVQRVFVNNLEPRVEDDITFQGSSKNKIVNLDSGLNDFSIEETGLHGFFPGKRIFIINNKKYYIIRNEEVIFNPPYILEKGDLYGISTQNVYDIKDIKAAKYLKFNIL